MTTSITSPNWRRWTLPGVYAAIVLGAVLLRGSDTLALALYRVTLPWSAVSYGGSSEVFGWFILVLGAIINLGLLFLIGVALDRRVGDPSRAA